MNRSQFVYFGILLVSCQRIRYGDSANILALIPAASPSHHIIHTTILEEMAARGHNVTVLSVLPKRPDVQLPPTYRHVYLNLSDAGDWSSFRTKMLNNDTKTDFMQFARIPLIMKMQTRRMIEILQHEIVRRLINSEQRFDLFVLGYTNFNEPLLGIAAHFQCPSVVISPIPALKMIRDLVGNPAEIATTPIFGKSGETETPPKFLGRFLLFIGYTIEYAITVIGDTFLAEPVYATHFPASSGYPTYDEVKKNVSLVLVNHHFSQGDFRPLYPNIVDIGGIQIRAEPKQLPEPIESFIRDAEHGFLLFSMGSNLKTSEMKRDKIEIFLNVLGKLKQRVIMKYESDDLPAGKAENILMVKWLPQNDLLAQQNVRLFISHCGLGAVGEAKFHGVPILAMPIYGDQFSNARAIVADGWARQLDFDNVTEASFAEAIEEMLTNGTYTENVQRISRLYRDRPQSPLETAIYWIEYVLRHRGARHMQSATVHLNFIQRNSIDVIAVFAVGMYAAWKLIRAILTVRKTRISFLVCITAAVVYWLMELYV